MHSCRNVRPKRREIKALGGIDERLAGNLPCQVMNGVVTGQNRGASWREGEPNPTGSRDREGRLAIRCDLDDSALASQRGRNIQIAFAVKRQALRSAQSAIIG